eukprot:590289-Prymnesium_polylepis.1
MVQVFDVEMGGGRRLKVSDFAALGPAVPDTVARPGVELGVPDRKGERPVSADMCWRYPLLQQGLNAEQVTPAVL